MTQPVEHLGSTIERLRVVVPVYNDWQSFSILLRQLDAAAGALNCRVAVSAMDDGSTQMADVAIAEAGTLKHLAEVEIIRLSVNVGHQRAIAVGLCQAIDDHNSDALLVMDSDGEDPPESIGNLLQAAAGKKNFVVVGARRKRTESKVFRTSYLLYKLAFRMIVGRRIGFGNFSLYSFGYAKRLVLLPDLWNNLAAAVLRSRLPLEQVLIDRGTRYAGKSQMNFTSLVVHGFSAIAVYADTIFVRLVVATAALTGLTVVSITVVLTLRLFVPTHATPGWATTVSFGMMILLVQVLATAITAMLSLLNGRMQKLIVPIRDYGVYVESRELLFRKG